jgi:hypothetical protein
MKKEEYYKIKVNFGTENRKLTSLFLGTYNLDSCHSGATLGLICFGDVGSRVYDYASHFACLGVKSYHTHVDLMKMDDMPFIVEVMFISSS